jgi:hypothetical protein
MGVPVFTQHREDDRLPPLVDLPRGSLRLLLDLILFFSLSPHTIYAQYAQVIDYIILRGHAIARTRYLTY